MIFTLLLIAATSTSTTAEADADAREATALERIADALEKISGTKKEKPVEPAAAPADTNTLQATIGLGFIWLAGNSYNLTFSGNASAQYKTEDWIFSGKAGGGYGKSRPAGVRGDPQISALNGAIAIRGDRRFTEKVTGYIAGGVDTDHVKAIDYRPAIEGGASLTWFEEKKEDFVLQSLRTDLGLRYAFESRFQFFPVEMDIPDDKILAPRLGVAFRFAPSELLIFNQDLEILPDVLQAEGESGTRVLLNSISKVTVKLTNRLSFALALDLKYDSQPAGELKDLDSALLVGLEVSL